MRYPYLIKVSLTHLLITSFLLHFHISINAQQCRTQDSLSLIAVFSDLGGVNFNVNDPIDTWVGVTLNQNGCVIRIDLDDALSGGTISPQIGNLTELEFLNLNENGITGVIPPEIGNLSNLEYLLMDENSLTGPIPTEIGNLTKLTYVNLVRNSLTGSLPSEIGNLVNLEYLSLGTNFFTGNIPNSFGLLEDLKVLNLSTNNFSGSIPSSLGNLFSLETLLLSGNMLLGSIPNSFTNLTNLERLWLFDNLLEGCYDDSLTMLCDILGPSTFGISSGNNFDTSWPAFCILDVGICDNCAVVDSLALVQLYAGSTGLNWDLCEPMSDWQGVSLNSDGCVVRIQLDNTLTGGEIPLELGDIENLIELDLEDCNLTGSIPASLGNLLNLEELDLEGNSLTGTIPISLASLPNLNELVLIENNLDGCYSPQLESLCNITNANNQISDGNNFDGSWFDFCNAQANDCLPCRAQDSLSLLAVFANFADVTYDFSGPLDSWRGIVLNENGCISEIDLDDCCIRDGSLPPEIGNFSELVYLNLNENSIDGIIPPEIGNLTNLEILLMDENDFTGPMPAELGNLTKLRRLNLQRNSLSGPIPSELGNLKNLNSLSLNRNRLTGSIPNSFTELVSLESLVLRDNDLGGCHDDSLTLLCDLIFAYQFNISSGNNFDARWDQFCNFGSGVCIEGCTDVNAANFNPNTDTSVESCVYPGFTCFAVSELNEAPNRLFNLNSETLEWTEVGVTGTSVLEAMAFDQSNGILYGFDGITFGRINTSTGEFTPIGKLGSANGEIGLIRLDDIDGLTYDPISKVMYATHRIEGSNDLLFVVNLKTGDFVPNAMIDSNGNLADYAVVEEIVDPNSNEVLLNVDDIAINTQTGQLFASQNSTLESVITIIDKTNGTLDQLVYDPSTQDIEGLAFNSRNHLVATTGNVTNTNPNSYLLIDYINQTETIIGAIDTSGIAEDFECIDCYQYLSLGCLDTLLVSNLISVDQNKIANINTSSDAQINNGSTRLAAGQCVELLPEFEVKIDAIFIAEIDACQ